MRKERLKNKNMFLFFLPVRTLFPHGCLNSTKNCKICWEEPPIKKSGPQRNSTIDLNYK